MNAKQIGYWVSLVLFSFAMGFGGIADLMKSPDIMESMKKLGYPEYLVLILGVWKIGGVIAILLPGCGLLKEWAYAGFFFDLTGASVSHAMVGDDAAKVIIPLVILVIGGCSWFLRPASRWIARPTAKVAFES
ncbi:MAG: DoxX family protein [Planctomycetaceae bacterium]|nr:DoxX family protein [Planctomycetaceae bacterium]